MPRFQNKRVSEGLCKKSAFIGPNKDGNVGNAEVTVPAAVTEGKAGGGGCRTTKRTARGAEPEQPRSCSLRAVWDGKE